LGKVNFRIGNLDFEHSLDPWQAALFLGVSKKTLRRLTIEGIVPAFWLPSKTPGKRFWRYRARDVWRIRNANANFKHAWRFTKDEEMPAELAAFFLDLKIESIYAARTRGILEDYTPKSIRKYLRKTIQRQQRSGLKKLITAQKKRIRHLESVLCKTRTVCSQLIISQKLLSSSRQGNLRNSDGSNPASRAFSQKAPVAQGFSFP
jgi:hypothetical protein